jgi:hypothetical protein
MEARSISVPKLGWSFAELEVASGLSRATLYRLLAAGQLATVKIRGRRLVPAWQAQALLDGKVTESAQ